MFNFFKSNKTKNTRVSPVEERAYEMAKIVATVCDTTFSVDKCYLENVYDTTRLACERIGVEFSEKDFAAVREDSIWGNKINITQCVKDSVERRYVDFKQVKA